MIVPVLRSVGGLIIRRLPAVSSQAGKRLLPSVVSKVSTSTAMKTRNVVRTTILGSRKNLTAGAVTSPGSATSKSWFSKLADKTPGWLKKAATFTGEIIAFNELSDLIFGSDSDSEKKEDGSNDQDSISQENLADSALSNILSVNGHSKLLEINDNIIGDDLINSSRIFDIVDGIKGLFLSRRAIAGDTLNYSQQIFVDTMTDTERGFAVTRLINMIKLICFSSETPELMMLLANQSVASGMINPQVTNAFDEVISMDAYEKTNMERKASESNILYQGLSDEIAQAAFQDYFDSSSSNVLDFFDVFDLSSTDDEIIDSVRACRLARLSSDDSIGVTLGLYDKFTVDSDGKDDESAALNRTIYYSKVSNNFVNFFTALSMRDQYMIDNYLRK